MEIEQPAIEVCSCKPAYSIEPHGDAHALYFGRCDHLHGYNLCRITEPAFNCDFEHLTLLLNAE